MKGEKGVATGTTGGIRPIVWLLFGGGVVLASLVVFIVIRANPIQTVEYDDETFAEASSERISTGQHASNDERRGGYATWESEEQEVDHETWDAPRLAAENDPQIRAMQRTVRGIDINHEFNPQYHRARVIEAEGIRASVGSSCEVRILPVRTTRFNCLVRVRCGEDILYPDADQHAGYVPCSFEGEQVVRAVDDGITSADGDPKVSIDLESARVEIADSGPGVSPFRAELELQTPHRI
ncbi:MAG: hypothetical protein AAGF12_07020 [Myxococcota bacterium]